ncbi:glutathione S-transferase family protein [Halomonas alkaliantarctica]|uniref:Glutathione S-transferase family protein n=1 Tax=Halomonas alkaliantarctica TaxID=232346 RepID=A0ABY8LRD7_9GAMM|nr:glutathione S-transferase family protein [Halomonas alkaliantarctica]WGI26978.1 glutathione S-transferase family protein [Halomonas alkaliantarctica]
MITLWGRNNSTNVKKVRWALEELELPFEQIQAGLQHGVNNTPDYLAMNPNGLVPLLKDDATDSLLWESNAIIRYLAAQYGQSKLWIEEPAKRAQMEKWMEWANSTLTPNHRKILMGFVRTPPEKRDNAAIEAAVKESEALFAIMDNALADQAWFSGEAFGLADIALAPFVYNMLNSGLTWQTHSNLERWYQQLTEIPSFQKVVMIPVT